MPRKLNNAIEKINNTQIMMISIGLRLLSDVVRGERDKRHTHTHNALDTVSLKEIIWQRALTQLHTTKMFAWKLSMQRTRRKKVPRIVGGSLFGIRSKRLECFVNNKNAIICGMEWVWAKQKLKKIILFLYYCVRNRRRMKNLITWICACILLVSRLYVKIGWQRDTQMYANCWLLSLFMFNLYTTIFSTNFLRTFDRDVFEPTGKEPIETKRKCSIFYEIGFYHRTHTLGAD